MKSTLMINRFDKPYLYLTLGFALFLTSTSYADEESILGYSAEINALELAQSTSSIEPEEERIAYILGSDAESIVAQPVLRNKLLSASLLNEVLEVRLISESE